MPDGEMGYVYTLSDPRTSEPKYVGATKHPQERLYNHLHNSPNQDVAEWKSELAEEGLEPTMTVVSVVPLEDLPDREHEVVETLSDEWDLLNRDGGPRYPRQRTSTSTEPDLPEATLSERDIEKIQAMTDIVEDFGDGGEFDRAATIVRETRSEIGI